MTEEEFAEAYKGCKVRVNGRYPLHTGKCGVVKEYHGPYVIVALEDNAHAQFYTDELDLIDEAKIDNTPLPLPG